MKLLFDQNLSPKLVALLADIFPGSAHVQSLGLDKAQDLMIWEHAKNEGFVIVSKDVDYNNLSVLLGNPPKVIWLLLGNCTTQQVADAIRARSDQMSAFESDASMGTFILQ